MKRVLFVLVPCFVLALSLATREETNVDRKLKQTETSLITTAESTVETNEVSTDSVFSNSAGISTYTGRRNIKLTFPLTLQTSTVALAALVNCTTSVPRNINATRPEGRLDVVSTASLEECCKECRRRRDPICRSWWRLNEVNITTCYLNRNR
eukprot:g3743.t1